MVPSLGVSPVPEIFFPRRGELCPVEKVSYKGYSPPKFTCNDIIHKIIHTHSYKICISLYECPCHAPFPESSPTPSHTQLSCMRTIFKTKAFCFEIHWTTSKYQTIGPSRRTLLLDNPPIEFIGQTSDIIYWTTLRYNLLDNPPI